MTLLLLFLWLVLTRTLVGVTDFLFKVCTGWYSALTVLARDNRVECLNISIDVILIAAGSPTVVMASPRDPAAQ